MYTTRHAVSRNNFTSFKNSYINTPNDKMTKKEAMWVVKN